MRILLIDDAEPVRAIVGEMLAHFDPAVRIDEARDGDEALRLYRECGPYDIVVTDYDHPGLNGYLLAEAIRKENPAQPIGCVTATWDAGRLLWQKLKIPTLAKPFETWQLEQLLEVAAKLVEHTK